MLPANVETREATVSLPINEVKKKRATPTEARLREKIRQIRNHQALTAQQKGIEIQLIMQGKNSKYVENSNPRSSSRRSSNRKGKFVPNINLECAHYSKECSRLYFSCCDTLDPCHRCHMERGCDASPPQVTSICCNACDTEQPPGHICINDKCGIQFSTSHCSKCVVWTKSDIHHCDGCGLCRVGKKDGLFHCDHCEACFDSATRSTHVCTLVSMKNQR